MQPQSTNFAFGTKGETLQKLTTIVPEVQFCPQEIIKKSEWHADSVAVFERICARLGNADLAVRSSAQGEDSENESMAGAFTSVLNVRPEQAHLSQAVDEVFGSYRKSDADEEVLVQPMVRNVAVSGVVLTRDLDTGSPYYVINYDDASGRTDTVTGGHETKTVLVHRARPDKLKSARLRRLINSIIRIEKTIGETELDIEFCITGDEDVFILQVRPLAVKSKWTPIPDTIIEGAINGIRRSIVDLSSPQPELYGEGTVLSEMTDWNPAEMIGNAPRPLALSLYKELITDRIWSEARALMGYRSVDGPLLYDLSGRPYIDVRRSFNSFLPKEISAEHAHRLVSHQLSVLAENRDLHDKVEFEIAVTCADFNPAKLRDRLSAAGFNSSESSRIEAAINSLTSRILKRGNADLATLMAQADTLLEPDPSVISLPPLARVHRLLDNCRQHGTLPFSQLARHGFIGVQLLRSLVARGVFTSRDMDLFMQGVHTVATDLIHDFHALSTGALAQPAFLSRYGHLRPGTYDILSWRYDERPELYLKRSSDVMPEPAGDFVPRDDQRRDIQALLDEAGFEMTPDDLLSYIGTAIKGREQSKFAFTRAISDALKTLSEWGKGLELDRDALSFLPVSAFRENVDRDALDEQITAAREAYLLTRAIRLPHVIFETADVDIVRIPMGQPTFITDVSVTAKVQYLTTNEICEIDGHIVLIESADPGFDWIFSHRILGLVTKYGGANSHMAIRSAEFGLPAAIGCGERLFNTLCKAQTIELNAAARRVVGH